ncbi:MAG: hydrogenase maturation protease [Sulfolobales archaeon]|nr:hydrogenase maturation protease [Sulfolobales archaeon]MCX8186932.1 hydrogenase maturation protease [Sulfolobales archaeon]MDW7968811.1 hydrogenase maturation protease [Sulfolobales archaeon]
MLILKSDTELERKVKELMDGKVSIVCIGNELRGDDSVGIHICKELSKHGVRNQSECGDDFITCIYDVVTADKPSTLLLIDAVDLAVEPGSTVIADLDEVEEFLTPLSTHAIPLTTAVELVKAVTKHEFRALVLGIQVLSTLPNQTLSSDLVKAVDNVVKAITKVVNA